MQLHLVTFSKEQLDSIPEAERTLIVLLGHAANELGVLGKLLHFALREQGNEPVFAQARNTQALTLVRILSGKIYECWKLLGKAFFTTQISKQYEPLFDDESSKALSALKRYFGKKNLIKVVRNKFAFHYSVEQIRPGYAKLVEGDALGMYLSERNVNSLYVCSESIAGRALMEELSPTDHSLSLGTLIDEALKANGWLSDIISACMSTCFTLHIGGDLYSLGARLIDVEGTPDCKSVTIPYFIEFDQDAGT
jgi:hypothetical protein